MLPNVKPSIASSGAGKVHLSDDRLSLSLETGRRQVRVYVLRTLGQLTWQHLSPSLSGTTRVDNDSEIEREYTWVSKVDRT